MKLDALVFDAYGTLFDVHSVMRRCEACWPGKGAALSTMWRAKQLEYTWQRSLMRTYRPFSEVTRDALEHTCEALGLELSPARQEELMGEYLTLSLFPDVPGALAKLTGKKAILSNGSPDILEPLVRNSGLRFDAVLSVDELKIFKPAPEVYALAAKRLDAEPGRIGFVSSNCWDALGARAFGFKAFWINRTGAPVDRLGVRPDAVLKSLGDLPEVLR
ncbi:MAG: 2-haloacid dehalogenase [Betaproteobacteria bacterium]|jgi:2-haloacid dehalogenase|nr:2-haloacid dehalogenase [Betaproteobacteria bacterium]